MQRAAAPIAEAASRLLFGFTTRHMRLHCRFHFRGPLDGEIASGRPLLLALWHQDVLTLFHYLAARGRLEHGRRFAMLSSRSFDGEITERVMRPWGFSFSRGSFGKEGGASALRGLLRAARRGESVVLVADGPLPPAQVMRPGPLHVARESGLPLYVARAWARPQILLPHTWFRMAVPLPAAHVALFSDGPIDVSGELEAARGRAESSLHALGEACDAHLYLRSRVAGGERLAVG